MLRVTERLQQCIFTDKSNIEWQECAHEFTNNWIARREHRVRALCGRSHLAIDQACPSDGRNPPRTHVGKRDSTNHRRRTKYLDVATLFQDMNEK